MPTKTVHYVFESPIKGIEQARITVGTVTILGMGEYAKRRDVYRRRFQEIAGLDASKQISEKEYAEIDPALRAYSDAWARWARIESAVREVKVKLDGMEGFMDASLSELGWDTTDGLETMPGDLLEALDRRTIQVNPGVFGLYAPDDADPNERKVGVIESK